VTHALALVGSVQAKDLLLACPRKVSPRLGVPVPDLGLEEQRDSCWTIEELDGSDCALAVPSRRTRCSRHLRESWTRRSLAPHPGEPLVVAAHFNPVRPIRGVDSVFRRCPGNYGPDT